METEKSGDTSALIDFVTSTYGQSPISLPVKPEHLDPFYAGAIPPVVALPDGMRLHALKEFADAFRTRPGLISDRAVVTQAESLVDYVNRFKLAESALFLTDNPTEPALTAIIDYHGATAPALPANCKHTVRYAFPLTDQWKAWMKVTIASSDPRTLLSQEDFANFMEDHQNDIENPPADWLMLTGDTLAVVLDLLNLHDDKAPKDEEGNYIDTAQALVDASDPQDQDEDRYVPRSALYKLRQKRFGNVVRMTKLAQGVSLSQGSRVTQNINIRTGERELFFKEENSTHDGSGRKVTVPEMFFINIPVFEGDEPRLLPVRVFYRAGGGSLRWGLQLIDPNRMLRRAVGAVGRQVAEDTSLPLYFGKATT
ncbi:DUF2303 family protein [Azospirillum sp. B4]|uniref:DUF2303 family protein n=1 Tax=Azospirillum sp. B4 TaxID=95605 RepID=UPI0003497B5E|nr:DUF2303 family protein [Azospirillum sp. B4]